MSTTPLRSWRIARSFSWASVGLIRKATSHVMSVARPEVDLALLAAREHVSERVRDDIVRVSKKCGDPRLFLQVCSLQKVILPVHHTLSSVEWPEPLPFVEEAVAALEQWVTRWARSRRRLTRGAVVVHRLLSDAGFDFAFLRGLSFAKQYYDFPGLRSSSDIDLLVRADTYPKVEEVFHDIGFRNESCDALHQARVYYVGQSELYHPQWRLRADLNYRLTGNGGIGAVSGNTTDIWARATQVDGRLWRLSDEDAFLDQIRHMCPRPCPWAIAQTEGGFGISSTVECRSWSGFEEQAAWMLWHVQTECPQLYARLVGD